MIAARDPNLVWRVLARRQEDRDMFRKEKVELPESAYWALLVYFLAIGGLTATGADTADMVDLFKRIGLDGNGILTLIGIYVAYVLVRRQYKSSGYK